MTLLEVVLSLSLLTALAMSITLLIVPIARQRRIDHEFAVATTRARQTLDAIHGMSLREAVKRFPNGYHERLEDLPEGLLIVRHERRQPSALLIHLTVRWTSADLDLVEREFHTARSE